MRGLLLALFLGGCVVGCGSTLQRPDGGGAGNTGTGSNTGTGGTSGSGGTGGGCVVDGVTHPEGSEFPCTLGGCAPCACRQGRIAIFAVNCNNYDGGLGAICEVNTTYRYGDTGGLVASESTTTLSPPRSWTRTRTSRVTDPASASCEVPLPCDITGDPGVAVEIERIKIDLAHADVQSALAQPTPPTYGGDARPVDGTIFQFLRDDGRGFLAGNPCGGAAACVDVPTGIASLVADLRSLDARMLTDPGCAALR